MAHPLEEKLVSVRARVRRLLAIYGVSWVVTMAVAGSLVWGLVDYWLRIEDRGIRLMASMAVLALVVWAAYRYLYRALATRIGQLEMARYVERRFPQFHDALSSAVEFVRQGEGDPTAGSVSLRRAVIARATAEAEPLDFGQAVEPRPAWRALLVAAGAVLLAVAVVLADPRSARTAIARLVNPLGDVAWPQVHHLMVRDPVRRIARGQTFEVTVVDRYGRRLPREVFIHYRFTNPDGTVTEETRRMQFTGQAMVDRRANVTRSFSYRAEGGDDHSMPWHQVEVLEPPAVESITTVLAPPAYTGWPEQQAEGSLRALEGTQVTIHARATKPLRSATLCLDDGRRLASSVSQEGYEILFPPPGQQPLQVERAGDYWLELVDRDGLRGGSEDHWSIQVVRDEPPAVTIETPSGNLFVTPQATVPVRVVATDDLAIQRICLQYGPATEGESAAQTVPLFVGPERAESRPPATAGETPEPDRQEVDHRWDLGPLGLQPGDRLTFLATAADYRPQTGRSTARLLVVVTPEQLADHIAARQSLILRELARALQIQQQSHDRVASTAIRLDELKQLDQLDIDHLQGAELSQRQVARILTSPSEGVRMHIRGLLNDVENNHLDSPDIRRQMDELLTELDRLEKEHLTTISHQLTRAIKAAQIQLDERLAAGPEDRPPALPDPAVAAGLAEAEKHQQAVIGALEAILAELSRWADYRRFHRDLGQLFAKQEELAQRTAQLAQSTLAKSLQDLTRQEVAELRVAARDQRELARRFDRLMLDMGESVDAIREIDPLAADNISDALHRAQQLGTSAQMQLAADEISANRLSQAAQLQSQVREGLRELLDILANRRTSQLERLADQLLQAERELGQLARRQAQLRQQAEEAAAEAQAEQQRKLAELRHRQDDLRQQAERMARRLERLMARRAEQLVREATESMQAASQGAEQGNAQQTAEQAAKAQKKLEEAQQQVGQTRRQTEAELAMEQLARLEDALTGIRAQQEAAIEETQRLDQLFRSQGNWTRGQLVSLRDLARHQQMLSEQTAALADKLVGGAVFGLVLEGTANDMNRAAQQLDRRQTGTTTQQAQQHALARLDQLLEALKPEEDEQGQRKGASPGGAGKQPGGPAMAQALQALAELKLLKFMQEEVNRRTSQLEQAFGGKENLDEDARREYQQLSREQGQLADLMFQLISPQPEPDATNVSLPQQQQQEQNR